MSGSRSIDIDEFIIKDCFRACVAAYCNAQDMCSKSCELLKYCSDVCNALGCDDGDFTKWTYKNLFTAMKMINGKVIIQSSKHCFSVSAEGIFPEKRQKKVDKA